MMKTSLIIALTIAAFLPSVTTAEAKSPGRSDAAAKGTKPYPLKTCMVTDNGLGSMGDEQRLVHQGQEIKFCCKPCIAKFKKNPAKYLPKLR